MDRVNKLAQEYAAVLVEYHMMRQVQDDKKTRRAYERLVLAQNILDSAAIRKAEQAVAEGI